MGAVGHLPPAFAPREEDEGTTTSGGTRLILRYRWDTREASAFWGDDELSPVLFVRHGGVSILELAQLPGRVWSPLDAERSACLERTLLSTSVLAVVGDRPEPGLLLVQEEGMARRPSLLLELSAADILRYWALLTVDQRAAFLEARAAIAGDDDPLVARLAPLQAEPSLFDRFAGVFHAFACLEDHVRVALAAGKYREAEYRLFGKKYDSLGTLLDRILTDVAAGVGDRVEHYVVLLCSRQLLREIGRTFPDYWAQRRDDVRVLESRIGEGVTVRAGLAEVDADMPAFLDWFDRWFLRRAAAVQPEDEES